jgi:hypothetical protein
VVFFTKEFTAIDKPLAPMIRIDLTLPDGTTVEQLAEFDAEVFSASTGTCDVRIGVEATYSIGGRSSTTTGVGYHDHAADERVVLFEIRRTARICPR